MTIKMRMMIMPTTGPAGSVFGFWFSAGGMRPLYYRAFAVIPGGEGGLGQLRLVVFVVAFHAFVQKFDGFIFIQIFADDARAGLFESFVILKVIFGLFFEIVAEIVDRFDVIDALVLRQYRN